MTSIKGEKKFMDTLTQYNSAKKLIQLAADPIDLSQESVLTPERVERYQAETCGYRFYYGTERITDEVMDQLQELASEAHVHHKMERMQAGEVMNYIEGYESENRPVLHTALRDFFENPNPSEKARYATNQARGEIDKLKAFIQKMEADNTFSDLIVIGIGGSNLGPQANYLALQYLKKPNRNVHFISNVDPDNAAEVLRQVDLKRTLVLSVSKSGTTLETCSNEAFVKEKFSKLGLNLKDHFICATGEGSPMDKSPNYLQKFHIWDWVGGRFSSTSIIGGIILSFACGFQTYWEFLKGASRMDKAAMNQDIRENLPLLAALLGIWNHNFLNYHTLAIIPYSQALHRYSAHLQQLDMESNGKHINRKGEPLTYRSGPLIWGEPGTNAQHSFYQLIHQGTEIVPLEFIGFKESQYTEDSTFEETTLQQKLLANLFAQAIALAKGQKSDNPNHEFQGNRPSHILLGKKLTPALLGSYLSYYEHKVAFQGFIWDINSFDQEGVQLGKRLAKDILHLFEDQNDGKEPSLNFPLGQAYLKQLKLM